MSESSLNQIRQRIDDVDAQIQQLISDRAGLAQEVAKLKAAEGGSEVTDCYRPGREAEVLRMAMERNQGPLSDDTMGRLVREIMSACLALESPLKVAYLGPEGTYTHSAVLKHFGHAVEAQSQTAIDEIFRSVESGNTAYGVVPVENSIEGVVNHTLDVFASSPLKICGEVTLAVHHCLLSNAENAESIERVYAHAQALAQCRKWLDDKLPGADRIAVSSNAEGARLARDDDQAAAIAAESAAAIYELSVFAEFIEDEPDNSTRFLVIGKQSVPATGQDMTSILLSAPNQPGALFTLLKPFADAGIDLTRIESRPSRRQAWDYYFFVDMVGHCDDPEIATVLEKIQQSSVFFKLLGSFPRAVLPD